MIFENADQERLFGEAQMWIRRAIPISIEGEPPLIDAMEASREGPFIYLGLAAEVRASIVVAPIGAQWLVKPACQLSVTAGVRGILGANRDLSERLVRENANNMIGAFEVTNDGSLNLSVGMPGSAWSEASLVQTVKILCWRANLAELRLRSAE